VDWPKLAEAVADGGGVGEIEMKMVMLPFWASSAEIGAGLFVWHD
jgi:hypothetical protein